MAIPFRLSGGTGKYEDVQYTVPSLTTNDFENVLNEGRLKVNPVDYNTWQPTTKQGVGAAFQNLLNNVSNNYQSFTPGYNAFTGEGGHDPRAKQLIGAFTGQGLNFADDTGAVSLTPGGLNVQSRQGWSAGFNPMGGNINIGSFGLQGTWAGDKSIQATVNFGKPKDIFNDLEYKPINIHGPGGNVQYGVESNLTPAQLLRDEVLYKYQQTNPDTWYKP